MNPAVPRAWLLQDGDWQPAASLPLTDRAVRYGMAVFETVGIRDGQPLLSRPHLDLLAHSARRLLGTAVGQLDSLPRLDSSCRGVLRLYVTAGDGAPHDPVTQPRVFGLFEAVGSAVPDAQTARLHPEPVAPFGHGCKTANYWTHCAAQSAAHAEGFDHALLADHRGFLLSAAFGNLFFVLGDRLCTPSRNLAVRPGVLRSWIMDRLAVEEVELPADRLHEVAEVFLTNSRLGVLPLRFGAVAPGPRGCALRDQVRCENIIP